MREREREKQPSFPCKVALQSSPGSLPLIRNYGQLLLKDRSNTGMPVTHPEKFIENAGGR